MNGWVPVVLAVLRIAAWVIIGYLLLLFLLQRTVVFPGARRASPRATAATVPSETRQLWLETGSERVEAWLLASDEPAPVIVFFHGNGELIEDWRGPMNAFRQRGLHVLLVEFPGYGHSGGRPGREALRRVARTAFDEVGRELGDRAAGVVPMGRSLGGAVAADLTLDRPAPALVLLSTFGSAAAMAWEQFRFPSWLLRDRFDAEAAVRAFPGPVLVLHGRSDDIVPLEHAHRLARAGEGDGAGTGQAAGARAGRVQVVELACAHNDCLVVWPRIVGEVTDFLEREGLLGGEREGA